MGKKEDMLKQLQSERQALPGGLQTLIRGGEEKPQNVKKKEEDKASPALDEIAEKGRAGRPKSNFNDFHTSLDIDQDLYLQMKRIALEQGGRSIKEIINEALINWIEVNK